MAKDPDFSTKLDDRVMSRRGFLGAIGGAVAGATMIGASGAIALPSFGGSSAGAMTAGGMATGKVTQAMLGIQLWTCLAEYLADTEDTFQTLAQIGYKYVEYAFGYGSPGAPPKTFRKALDDAGLWCNGGHGTSPYPYDDKTWKQYVEDNLVIGSPYL